MPILNRDKANRSLLGKVKQQKAKFSYCLNRS